MPSIEVLEKREPIQDERVASFATLENRRALFRFGFFRGRSGPIPEKFIPGHDVVCDIRLPESL